MSKLSIQTELDEALVRRAQAEGDLALVIEDALLARFSASDRWAEEHGLMVEALAGGAEEAKA